VRNIFRLSRLARSAASTKQMIILSVVAVALSSHCADRTEHLQTIWRVTASTPSQCTRRTSEHTNRRFVRARSLHWPPRSPDL